MTRSAWSAGVLVFCVALVCTQRSLGQLPSFCLRFDETCLAPGGLHVDAVVGAGAYRIAAAQFSIRFDPALLTVVDVLPGRVCDPNSPFALELVEVVNQGAGVLVYAVGIDFLGGMQATGQSATMACVQFVPTTGQDATVETCLYPLATDPVVLLVDDHGTSVEIDNSVACPQDPPAISCSDIVLQEQCRCDPDTADCHGLDTACRTGVCNGTTLFCEVAAINEGGGCDDQDACTTVDRCEGGVCVGTGCTNPTLCMTTDDCWLGDTPVTVVIELSAGDRIITGGQFSFHYDPTSLELVDVAPGASCDPASPFVLELIENVSAGSGDVFYAAGVDLGGSGTRGPAALACVTFIPRQFPIPDVCLFQGINPFHTRLADDRGQSVPLGDSKQCPSVGELPFLSCVGFQACRIPTVSAWGLLVLTLLLLISAKLQFGFRESAAS